MQCLIKYLPLVLGAAAEESMEHGTARFIGVGRTIGPTIKIKYIISSLFYW